MGLRWSRAGGGVILTANGSGRGNAAEAVRLAFQQFAVRAVVSTGWCGALDPALEVGQIVVADRVKTLEPAAEFPARRPAGNGEPHYGTILTVDRFVASAEEKRRLRTTGAAAVEMEAAAVAAEACQRDLPFYCVRAVSDPAGFTIRTDLNRARFPDGRFSPVRIAAQAGLVPGRWLQLGRLWSWSRAAAEALGEFFGRCRFDT